MELAKPNLLLPIEDLEKVKSGSPKKRIALYFFQAICKIYQQIPNSYITRICGKIGERNQKG